MTLYKLTNDFLVLKKNLLVALNVIILCYPSNDTSKTFG